MDEHVYGNQRLIHLDFKRCPVKVSFLKKLFEFISRYGCTGVLLEWEDTFPYQGELREIGSDSKPYSAQDVTEILAAATSCNLEVVPLIQCIGHLEFVLKHSKWKHLREIPSYVSSMCPANPDSFPLIKEMIAQILVVHSKVRFLHIGGDEVWHMGKCESCSGNDTHRLYLQHITSVLKFVCECYPGITCTMWDDMMRNMNLELLREFDIGKLVEPMIWEYRDGEVLNLFQGISSKYSAVFEKIWIASAYKGATGCCQITPVPAYHVSNHEAWLGVIQNNKSFKLRGICITGWTRYDHYAVLCDLLPASIPSLILCLKVWTMGKSSPDIYKEISSALGFTEEAPMALIPKRPQPVAKSLLFPGSAAFVAVEKFMNARSQFNEVTFGDQSLTWFNEWFVKRNFISVMQLDVIFPRFKQLLDEFSIIEPDLKTGLSEVFYEDIILEWFGCFFDPLKEKLQELSQLAQSQLDLHKN